MTSLFDASNPNERDPRRFIDAANIPYVVLPPVGFKHAKLGDFAIVVNLRNGKVAGAILGGWGAPEGKNGGGCISFAKRVGGGFYQRTCGGRARITYALY